MLLLADRILKLAISACFFAMTWARDQVLRLAGKPRHSICVVLFYHAVPAPQRQRFARQMDLLRRWAKPVAADLATPLSGAPRFAAVTFDDGFQSVVENAVPELVQRGIPATIFVVSGGLGDAPKWLTEVGVQNRCERVMEPEQVRALPPLITVGSHTESHPFLPCLSEAQVRRELLASRQELEALRQSPVDLISIPFGATNDCLLRWCRDAGYRRVFTITPSLASGQDFEYATGRVWADPAEWEVEFSLKLLGAYRWLPAAFSVKKFALGLVRRKPSACNQRFCADWQSAPGASPRGAEPGSR